MKFNANKLKPKIKLTGKVVNPGDDGWRGLTRKEQIERGLIDSNNNYTGKTNG